ncbi:MAG: ectoine hydroxylase-related dioxygenase (phytanoyl-CoA dioxygenase family) [Candidatus Latescibacterota bacterium]|jgi:ectoine hydroxylase-related dioxygenase (phytanoyl-CoA dioxygenase family)
MSGLSDAHIDELDGEGFIVVPDFISGEQLKTLQAAQRRVLPTWEKIRDDPPQDQAGHSQLACFPHEEMELYKAAMDAESIAFARKWLKTEAIHMRVGCLIARYPGHAGGGTGFDDSALHIDNGNNSLLPMSESLREFGQIGFWIHLEDVDEDQAPLRLIAKKHGRDMRQCVPLVCKAGTLCIFTNSTWHSASAYVREDGQRFTWGYAFGRADHYWEGFRHYTHLGKGAPVFQQFIGGLTAQQRELWRFPPAGHAYYTEQTLKLLEEQYPGWNSDEYRPG